MESARLQRKQNTSESVSKGVQGTRSPAAIRRDWPLNLRDTKPPVLRLGQGFGSSPTRFPHVLQTKLTINEPGDQYEQEADRVAEQVMRMPDPAIRLQRKCGCGGSTSSGESCSECTSPREQLQRRASAENSSGPAVAPLVVHDVLRSSGQPLDQSTRAFMEQRFGHDFGRVRVHADAPAAESARAVNALAYTVGNDVAFSFGQYAPHTAAGKRLLAHELAHVIQQSGASVNAGKPAGQFALSSLPVRERTTGGGLHRRLNPESNARPSGGLERIADKMASAAGAGDNRLARLNQLRMRLGGISSLSLSREAATVFQGAYERARASLPRWVPVPSLNFLGALAPPMPVPPIPIPVVPVLIIILLLILILYLVHEEVPTTTPDREREIDDVLDEVDRIIRRQRPRGTREPAPSPEPEGQPPPRNPQPVDPISPPQEEEPCCCCVNSVEILNSANIHTSQRIDDDHRMGHHFQTAFGMSYRGTGERRSCTLEWWESTNLPYASGMQPNQYSNRYCPGASSFAAWDSRPEPCPGDPPAVVDTDEPHIPKSMGDANRFLRFVIIARSGRGCVCPNPSVRITARQRLLLQSGVPNWNASDFLVPNPVNDPAAPQ